ncbi:hypothetical protein [Halobaculum sp. D14]|uniref:hypothetical protein n=1 Tax=Halobaculum sp. D14 TaxID=3421642 RepID=UPI003EB950D7
MTRTIRALALFLLGTLLLAALAGVAAVRRRLGRGGDESTSYAAAVRRRHRRRRLRARSRDRAASGADANERV